MLFHLLTHSLVDPCTFPDRGSNPQPWRIGISPNRLRYPARVLFPCFQVIHSPHCPGVKLWIPQPATHGHPDWLSHVAHPSWPPMELSINCSLTMCSAPFLTLFPRSAHNSPVHSSAKVAFKTGSGTSSSRKPSWMSCPLLPMGTVPPPLAHTALGAQRPSRVALYRDRFLMKD